MDEKKIENAVKEILMAIGEDPAREGLMETPARVAKMYGEVFASLDESPEFDDYKVFHVEEDPGMVLVQQIPFYSMCEHHLLPFFGTANVAYVPRDGQIMGLSKIPRLVDFVAKRPGVQERITTQIAAQMKRILQPKGIAVSLSARHMCMEMRGISKSGLFTYTSKFDGVFKSDVEMRNEFLRQTGNHSE
ncbi:GTP cyclohydrolase I FolE [Paucilactobacillus wasatchensis]|uniref:GTP cyclohydrolase 1 n=1 Tax=Paucilactobacillus wasatchensis TaxID=1335616 RepID=A0A0D0Y368_9LACO|nr:GTP cyclohydrolase I FolE [Paucilactobacillus wasatchensis]KIS02708.1 GTP cyclohydrolase I type 1 [Paucilactobacillus wasatchensis]